MFRKKYIVDCFTDRSEVYEFSKPSQATHYYPEWWKELPRSGDVWENLFPNLTMKSCPGFINFFKKSYVLPLWSDLRLEVGEIGNSSFSWQYADKKSFLDSHHPVQWGNWIDTNQYQHVKLHSPWFFYTNKPLLWAYMPPTWHTVNDLEGVTVLSAVDDYYYQNATNVNFIIKRQKEKKIIDLPYNFPLAHIVPLTESNVEFRYHLVDENEMRRKVDRKDVRLKFLNNYFFTKKVCPYHKGN